MGPLLVLALLTGVGSTWFYMRTHGTAASDLARLGKSWRTNTTTVPGPAPAPTTPVPPTAPTTATAPAAPTTTAARYGIAAGGKPMYMDPAELDTHFAQIKDLGVGWVRWDIDWNNVQPNSKNEFLWEGVDRAVSTANKYQLQSVAILTSTPPWARQSGCPDSDACQPANPDDFAAFARAAADRYKGQGLSTFEVWNEPNSVDYWQPKPDLATYSALLQKSYTAIKGANPNATVIAGALAAMGDEDNNIAPITFVNQLYATLPSKPFDAISIHPYSYPALPSVVAWWNRWQQITPIHDAMVAHGDGAKKVWITEVGAPTGGPGTQHDTAQDVTYAYGSDFVSEALQDQIMASAVQLHNSYSAWAGPMFWYSFKDASAARTTPENFFGLTRPDGSKKPAYSTYQRAIKGQ